MTNDQKKSQQMETMSNLITDMTLKGATDSEIQQAVNYSRTVIDGRNKSEQDFGIPQLKAKYQSAF